MRTREEARTIARQLAGVMRKYSASGDREFRSGGYADHGYLGQSGKRHYFRAWGLVKQTDVKAIIEEVRNRNVFAKVRVRQPEAKTTNIFVNVHYLHEFETKQDVNVERLRKRADKLGYRLVRKDSSDQDDGRSVTVTDSHR